MFGSTTFAQEMPADYQEVLKSLDRKGDFKAGVLRVNIPRNDLKMTIQGFPTPTPFGFGGWLALTKASDGSDVMMGDLVLLQEEVNPVMSALLDNGIEVTALHNHFFWDEPHVYYMHVHGMGKAADLARKMKPGLDLIGHVRQRLRCPLLQVQMAPSWTLRNWPRLSGMTASNPARSTKSLWGATTSA